jgi:hypothetical protein
LTLKVPREFLALTSVLWGTGETQANECKILWSELFLKYETQRESERETERQREVMNSSRRLGEREREGRSGSCSRTGGERTLLLAGFQMSTARFSEGTLKTRQTD